MDQLISTPELKKTPDWQRQKLAILVALCVTLFLGSLQLYTQNNNFPYYSHADEHSKVEQLLIRDFNFNHPQLLLLTTDVVRKIRGQNAGYQRITMSGRWVSATFAAISVVLLTLIGWTAYGLIGAWCVGPLVAICPLIGMTAHFLKEDTAMLLGLSATGLTLALWNKNPSRRSLLWLGLACGLAVSSKYIATLALLPAILVVMANRQQVQELPRLSSLAHVLFPCALVFLLINYPILVQPESFAHGLIKGSALAIQGRSPANLPNLEVFEHMAELSWPVILMAGITIFMLVTRLTRERFVGWTILSIGVLFTGILISTPLGTPIRYLLIPAVSLYVLAGLGIAMLIEIICRYRETRLRPGITMAGAILAITLMWAAYPNYRTMAIDAFNQADARAALIHWANSTLGPDTVLAALRNSRLPGIANFEVADPEIQFSHALVTLSNLDNTSTWQLRKEGITHLILRKRDWSAFLAKSKIESANHESLTNPAESLPKKIWQPPRRFKKKNRWLSVELVVVQL